MACIELCGGVHTAQRQRLTQISIGFCTHFIGIGLGVGQCKLTTKLDQICRQFRDIGQNVEIPLYFMKFLEPEKVANFLMDIQNI